MPELQSDCEAHERLVCRSPGAGGGGGGDLGDLDYKNHRVFGLVAERSANHIHCVLMSHSLQTLAVHRQQLIPCLRRQTEGGLARRAKLQGEIGLIVINTS